MFFIDDVLVAEGIRDFRFACQIQSCLGACCEDGDRGAPLTPEEAEWIRLNHEKLNPVLEAESKQWIQDHGPVHEDEKILRTPLKGPEGPCVYLIQEGSGPKICGFQKLHKEGKIDFIKPLSCHLFPLIYSQSPYYRILSFETRSICRPACRDHHPLAVEFCKEPLIRQFGLEWVKKLYAEIGLEWPQTLG